MSESSAVRLALPRYALSIMQPWAALIVHGLKDIENRDWWTSYRGPVLVHAGKRVDRDAMEDVEAGRSPVTGESLDPAGLDRIRAAVSYPTGGIVGAVLIEGCVREHPSPWFVGKFGFVLTGALTLPFVPLRGQLGFFAADYYSSANPAPAPSPVGQQ